MNQVIRAGLSTATRRVAIKQWCSRLTYWRYPEGYHHLCEPSTSARTSPAGARGGCIASIMSCIEPRLSGLATT